MAKVNKVACYRFLMSDYTFISSWDESRDNLIGSWWDVEVGSVLCATLIDLQKPGRLTYRFV
jgi:hypothetical protein